MKNKRGEVNQVGMIIIIAVTLIVGVILFQVIEQQIGTSTNTIAVANTSLATVVNGTTQYLNYRALSDVVIFNETGNVLVSSGNYTVTNNVIHPTTGALSVSILPDASAAYKSAWKVSGTAQPTTYIASQGARSLAGLIGIFFALALVLVALTPILREKILSAIGK